MTIFSPNFYGSLEMEEERHYNELTGYGHVGPLGMAISGTTPTNRSRTTSSPVPTNRPLSPGKQQQNNVVSSVLFFSVKENLISINLFVSGLLSYGREGLGSTPASAAAAPVAPTSLIGAAAGAFSPMGRCPTCGQNLNVSSSSSPPHAVFTQSRDSGF